MIIGIVGTTIAPWMQFYLQSSIVEKRIGPDEYGISRWDVFVGCVMAAVVALALAPLAGSWAKTPFALGLANASLFAAPILLLATAYSICEGLGFEAGVNKTWSEAPEFLGLYTLMIAIGAGTILIPGVPLFPVLFLSQVLNGRFWNVVTWGTTGVMGILMLALVVTTVFPSLGGGH